MPLSLKAAEGLSIVALVSALYTVVKVLGADPEALPLVIVVPWPSVLRQQISWSMAVEALDLWAHAPVLVAGRSLPLVVQLLLGHVRPGLLTAAFKSTKALRSLA